MTFAELVAPDQAVIEARGQAPGTAVDADASMNLSDGPDGATVMDWSADVNIAAPSPASVHGSSRAPPTR